MTAQERIGNLLGLACRARKTICGDFAAEKHLKNHTVPMLFLAADGGADNVEKYRRLAARKGIAVVDILTKEELGRAVGKMQNVVVLLTDAGFAKAVDKVLRTTEKGVTR
ncbi:ribosomal L7Ae/L30e/S12e/Gadd45 family protein [Megasphaera butyrica]|jgi:ribosomal protein L7Ae-like RNA K-turn-binding protein|uniref:L7Ae/L30e/S12e/Gadd45 family ribosomal protein n=1 Tax=Megasphaera TaxID=906 RepID=UPI000820C7CE|nr:MULTISPECIES: ribosomal L7Ae/L30e/S12e/Gadd45 family protein [Megasphaera]MDN0047624.1 ribosomal L7Ae/L30e/S12e/Gadd45 family protein [Megasphaera hexanoica]SCJ10717.1 Ribosomal protein L7Ae/L30e/S12e/Gadd45 family [uncultured Ruminococcus sp.]MBM6732518.1 ribosomal L7Ae/L30e/S12e/Gadd45 family protein [Megasphaera stantonii]MCU6714570.1 ribosomal L7Ae/L30e/S12e/Gadd45 family protein [Megasphaera butyrica]NJE34888.1 50S ribosomal protein L7ae [Megasphaera sp. SW808]